MEGTLMLILLSVTMFVGSFVSGLIPLTLSLSESKMRFITIIGAGLLVGTALAVIIPEGVNTLYKNNNGNDHGMQKRDTISSLISSTTVQVALKVATADGKIKRHVHNHDHNHDEPNLLLDKVKNQNKADEDSHSHESSPHSIIGVTLVLGFVFMLIVDQIGGQIGHSTSKLFLQIDFLKNLNIVPF
jgi:solute carrier family 39 (zinc transporter), member 9